MSLTIAAQLAQIPAHHLKIMGYVDESAVNGPGCRAVVCVQGCSRECRGCFNPASWFFEINQLITVESLAAKILANPRNSGLTFSGGEPFWQAKALTELAKYVKEKGLNVMEVGTVSGHKTLQMLKRYTHLRAEELALRLG